MDSTRSRRKEESWEWLCDVCFAIKEKRRKLRMALWLVCWEEKNGENECFVTCVLQCWEWLCDQGEENKLCDLCFTMSLFYIMQCFVTCVLLLNTYPTDTNNTHDTYKHSQTLVTDTNTRYTQTLDTYKHILIAYKTRDFSWHTHTCLQNPWLLLTSLVTSNGFFSLSHCTCKQSNSQYQHFNYIKTLQFHWERHISKQFHISHKLVL